METIIHTVNDTFTRLFSVAELIDEAQLNTIPFEGSWTPGQILKHLVLGNSGFVQVLNGPVEDTTRDPLEKVTAIKRDFLDFTIKMKSPDFIVPPPINYKRDDLITALEKIRDGIDHTIQTLDLTKTCMTFEFPVYGFLTRSEAIYFVIYHTQRHTYQLENCHDFLPDPYT